MLRHVTILTFLSLALISSCTNAAVSQEVQRITNVAYGQHNKQVMDIYKPAEIDNAPIILMVHGGAWQGGDKANNAEFENKVMHWVPRGFVFISTNYRTFPEADPIEQTEDIGNALKYVQAHAYQWGGDSHKVILMGHSSGAHLISLLSAQLSQQKHSQIKPLLASVALDSSAFDLVHRYSEEGLPKLYQKVFGNNQEFLRKASPISSITANLPPFLAICSTYSSTACPQAHRFVNKAKQCGAGAKVVSVDLSHREINSELGKANDYTREVNNFLKTLSPRISSVLANHTSRM